MVNKIVQLSEPWYSHTYYLEKFCSSQGWGPWQGVPSRDIGQEWIPLKMVDLATPAQ